MLTTPDNLVLAEQFLCQVKDFTGFHAALPARKLGVHKNLEGDKGRTTDTKWLKGYFLFLIIWRHAEQ